jgi:putative glycosyltransferase (TIGR04348 family)
VKIKLVTPAPAGPLSGNRMTAKRWMRILEELGHKVSVAPSYDGGRCDAMIALHAARSADSIRRLRAKYPDVPLIVALTGTDLYRDIHNSAAARRSLELATRLVVLQSMALAELPPRLRKKSRVIYQSSPPMNGGLTAPRDGLFRVAVIGHLRSVKDPMRTALASRLLPRSSRIRVVHVGRALTRELKRRAAVEMRRNPRYRWLGEFPYWKTRRLLAGSHLVSLTSKMEGSSNVLSEAIVSSVPVVAAKISGLVGTLGRSYAGYFPAGDTRALARLLHRAETDTAFYNGLKAACRRLRPLIDPARERAAWAALLRELR